MSDTIQSQLDDLGRMATGDLVQRYEELHGHPCRTRHCAYLIRKIAWRSQANAEGDLTERATVSRAIGRLPEGRETAKRR
ncbi:MAG TPA: DUF2924 domain-containing protein [Phycisphaerales bacterium]|nr:DUF2924 domain-containing protein [Phycisphaerales bacterium]